MQTWKSPSSRLSTSLHPPESDDDESDIELADDDLDDDVVILEEDDEAAAQKRKLEDLGDLTPKEEVKRLKVTD